MRLRAVVRAVLLVLAPLAVAATPSSSAAQDERGGPVYVMRITGSIDLGLAPYVDRVIGAAEDGAAAAVVIEIDTPGGRLDAVIQMRDTILGADVPTIAFVDSSAYSAGALVAIAADEIYMSPGAVMGAATPVVGGTGEVADEKTISAVRASFEAAAEENGRDPAVAAAMVDTRVEIDGLVTGEELLTLTGSEAIEFGCSEGTVSDLDTLLAELGLENSELVVLNPGLAEQVVRFLTNPLLAGLLLLGGFLLIIGDFFSGGLGLAAAAGVALLAIFFWGHLIAGLAGWEDIALVLLGIGFIAVGVFVLPGFGVAGILGLASLAGGAFMAMIYRDFDFVTTGDLWRAGITVSITLLAAVAGLIGVIVLVSRHGAPSGLVLSARLGSGATLPDRASSGWLGWFDAGARLEPDRIERPEGTDHGADASLVGATGLAVSDLRPGGIVDLDGQRVDAVTAGEFVSAGSPIEVVRDDRYRRVVRRLG